MKSEISERKLVKVFVYYNSSMIYVWPPSPLHTLLQCVLNFFAPLVPSLCPYLLLWCRLVFSKGSATAVCRRASTALSTPCSGVRLPLLHSMLAAATAQAHGNKTLAIKCVAIPIIASMRSLLLYGCIVISLGFPSFKFFCKNEYSLKTC